MRLGFEVWVLGLRFEVWVLGLRFEVWDLELRFEVCVFGLGLFVVRVRKGRPTH